MSASASKKFWEKTKLANLVRHRNGGYYARLFINGKEVWKSLKTKTFSIAEVRLTTARKEHRERKARNAPAASAKMTFGQAAEAHRKNLDAKVNLKRRSRDYWREIHEGLFRNWPELENTEVKALSESACTHWAAVFAKKSSATRYNNTIAFLRHALEIAVKSGVIYSNPANVLERKAVKNKHLELPTLKQFSEFLTAIRNSRSRYAKASADFAEGLASTGCRLSEAGRIEWQDLDFKTGEIVVKGDPDERTKNGEIRRIPMIQSARALFERMRQERPDEPADGRVFQVKACRASLDVAAEKVAMKRITHHDLRHFFATVCIERGVDTPTVARWLGHKDGGVLAMRIYGHLRREHSLAQAKKVSFAPD